jgi:outer membrane protein assembly factor BamB
MQLMTTGKLCTCTVLATFSIVLSSRITSAADWPQFLGPHANGHTDERLPSTDWSNQPPQRLWSVELHDNGYSAPISAKGKVFILDHVGDNDVVLALNLNNGEEAWRFEYPSKIRNWYGHALATPAYDDGRLYTLSRAGQLHCLNASQGTKLWSCNTISQFAGKLAFYGMISSPLIDGEQLIVCAGGKSGVVALRKSSGDVLWTSPNGEPMGHATPVVTTLHDKKQYLVFTGSNLLGLHATDGTILWRYPWKTQEAMNAANPVRIGPDKILISSTDNGTALLRVERDFRITEVWRNRRLRGYYGTPLVCKDWIFTKDDSQQLVCLEAATGHEKWRQPKFGTRWYDSGGLLFGDKILVTNGRTGDLYLVAATGEGYRQLASLPSPAGPETLPAPILSQGILILRSRNQLAAFQLVPAKSSTLASGHER